MKSLHLESIDLSAFSTGSSKDEAAAVLNRVCRKEGIFCLSGHGISKDLLDRCFRLAFAFFELPEETKSKVPNSGRIPPRGYYPYGAYVKASAQAPNAADVRSGFSFFEPPSVQLGGPTGNDSGYDWPTVWPEEPAEFQECFKSYNRAMTALSYRMWRVIAYSLGLAEDYFVPLTKDPLSFSSINYYKHVGSWTPEYGPCRLPAHTDIMAYTLLISRSGASVPDYEVEIAPDEWVCVSAPPDTIIVQVGDLLQMWTNDQWRATKHRVAAPPPSETDNSRVSIVFGVVPDRDAIVSPLPAFISDGMPSKYAPTTFIEHEHRRMGRTIAKLEGKTI